MATLSEYATDLTIGTGATAIVDTTSAETKFVGQLTFTNTSTSSVLVTVYKLDTSATETAGSGGNWIIKKTVQPEKVWNAISAIGNITLDNLQTLSATAATGSVVKCHCAGVIET